MKTNMEELKDYIYNAEKKSRDDLAFMAALGFRGQEIQFKELKIEILRDKPIHFQVYASIQDALGMEMLDTNKHWPKEFYLDAMRMLRSVFYHRMLNIPEKDVLQCGSLIFDHLMNESDFNHRYYKLILCLI